MGAKVPTKEGTIVIDQGRIRRLLQEADDRWYTSHKGSFIYQEHLDFVAAYIAKHYYEGKKDAKRS